jgi:hypothetical protein
MKLREVRAVFLHHLPMCAFPDAKAVAALSSPSTSASIPFSTTAALLFAPMHSYLREG